MALEKPQEGPKVNARGHKIVQDGSKMIKCPSWPQEGLKEQDLFRTLLQTKLAAGRPQDEYRKAKNGSEMAQGCPK